MARFELKLILGFLLTLCVFSVLSAYTYLNNKAQLHTNQMVNHTTEVLLATQMLFNGLLDAETGQRGYVITGKQEYLEPYLSATASISESLGSLKELTADNPVQQNTIAKLKPLIDKRLEIMETVVQTRKEGFDRSRDLLLTLGGLGIMNDIRGLIADMQASEERLLNDRTLENKRKVALFNYTYGATGTAMMVILVVMFYVIYNNIQKQEKSQIDLERASTEIKDLYDKAPCGYFSVDNTIRVVNVNQTLLTWLGYTQDEVLGKMRYEDFLSPKTKKAFRETLEADFKRFKINGFVHDKEFEFMRKDETTLKVVVNSTAIFDRDGEFVKTRSSVFDNSERKRAEEERDNFFHNSLDLLVVLSMEGDFLRWNDAWKETLGYDEADLTNRNIGELVHPDDLERTFRELSEKLTTGKLVVSFENRYKAKDGEFHWLQWNAVPFPDKGIIYGFARDITEQKHSNEKIRQLNHELEAFTYSVSHDLRAPLRSITGFAHILSEDYSDVLDDEGRRITGIVINSAKKMGKLIDDLLDFARMGRKELSCSVLNMHEMVEDIVKEQTSYVNGKSMNIRVHTLKPSRADVSMLRQVWTNLISNALKYSTKKEVTDIEIGSFEEGGRSCYYVSDKGAGFDMQYAGKLFGVFQRLHKANEFEGTGVGLALVKRIIERHGGSVWAESKLNEGSKFYFSLPG